MNVLDIDDLSFAYEDLPGGQRKEVLRNLSFRVEEGESVGLIGANGVGKSTLLKLICGLLDIQQGKMVVAGLEVCRRNLKTIRSKVGYVFQDSDSQLFMSTVYEDVAFAPRNYGLKPEEVDEAVMRALSQVGMTERKDRQVYRLSGGEKKLASIATVLAMPVSLMLMDEPTVGLDPKNRRNLIRVVNSLNCAKLVASHDLDFILDTCQRVVLLTYEGTVIAGTAQDILNDQDLLESNGLELPLSKNYLNRIMPQTRPFD
jgi:cobalt/nickel transport system ATP-binding protein